MSVVNRIACTLMIVGALTATAFAADTQPAPPNDPCVRGQGSTIKLMGVDMQMMKCALAIAHRTEGVLTNQLDETVAKLLLTESDLAVAQKELTAAHEELSKLKPIGATAP